MILAEIVSRFSNVLADTRHFCHFAATTKSVMSSSHLSITNMDKSIGILPPPAAQRQIDVGFFSFESTAGILLHCYNIGGRFLVEHYTPKYHCLHQLGRLTCTYWGIWSVSATGLRPALSCGFATRRLSGTLPQTRQLLKGKWGSESGTHSRIKKSCLTAMCPQKSAEMLEGDSIQLWFTTATSVKWQLWCTQS